MRYHDITTEDMANGEGLRVVLWTAGCSHHCKGCQNSFTWDADGGLLFDAAAKEELYTELAKTYIAGVTFSGGDPLHPANRDSIAALAAEIKTRYPQKSIWLYTGANWEDIWQMPLMRNIDVLVDGEYQVALADKQLHWRGSSNQRVIDVSRTLLGSMPNVPVLYCE